MIFQISLQVSAPCSFFLAVADNGHTATKKDKALVGPSASNDVNDTTDTESFVCISAPSP